MTFGLDKVTVLYDAFGESKELTKDWGFSALVEHDGKRILFDTGNHAAIFEHNVKALGVDLTKLDFVVISHRHTDHTSGLKYVLSVALLILALRKTIVPEIGAVTIAQVSPAAVPTMEVD